MFLGGVRTFRTKMTEVFGEKKFFVSLDKVIAEFSYWNSEVSFA